MANSIKDLLQVDWNPQTFHKNGDRVPPWSLILSVDGKKVVMDWLDRGTLQMALHLATALFFSKL